MSQPSLLLVDDRQDNLDSLVLAFSRSDYEVSVARGGQAALDQMAERWFDVVVTDLKMPGVDGLEVVKAARSLTPPAAVIVITAHGSIPTAVESLREGAIDYLTKPVDLFELRQRVGLAMERQRLERENRFLHEALSQRYGFGALIGDSKPMREVFEQARRVAEARATVLITGPSGTGKELLARAIHNHGPLSRRPFVAVHCAALSEDLIDSELFGHERGAFTGAEASRPGRFETASDGTLFLDEVGDISPSAQVKLLRVLENREYQRVGGTRTLRSQARILAATHRDLEGLVRDGAFREDLFYRLSVVTIRMPPLCERQGDIPLLTSVFLREFTAGKPTRLTPAVLEAFEAYAWPGNVRELRNAIERLCVLKPGMVADSSDLPEAMGGKAAPRVGVQLEVGMSLDQVEQTVIEATLRAMDGNRTEAAKALGVSRRTLQRRLRERDE